MKPHLRQFAQQLKEWSQQIIEFGRTPFRRADCCVTISTDTGPAEIPLLLWINKQSLMAGGIVLLPESDWHLDQELKRGRSCATALGLSHFVTWEPARIRLWHITETDLVEQQTFPLSRTDHPDYFRLLLDDLVDALKVPAVTGAVSPEKLPALYFTNLFLITQDLAQTAVSEAFRSQRAGMTELPVDDIDQLAAEANRLLLLKVLWLLRSGHCPQKVLPEQMEQHIAEALNQAPEPWRTSFTYQWPLEPPRYAPETTIFYHHLLLRLRQLKWNQNPQRLDDSLVQLIHCWYGSSNGEEGDSVLHPQVPATAADTELLVTDSPLLIAATTLMRAVQNRPQPEIVHGSLFELEPGQLKGKSISARLLNPLPVPASEKPILSTKLRLSWPHRLLKISGSYPYWRAELLHLLGLLAPEQTLRAQVPLHIFDLAADDPLWNILETQFQILQIQTQNHHNLVFTAIREPQQESSILIKQNGSFREITTESDDTLKQQLLSALRPSAGPAAGPPVRRQDADTSAKLLRQKLLAQLTTRGIPSFPDQYFYYLDSPRTQTFEISPPLRQTANILGRFELEDATGQTLTGEGEDLATALLLCAKTGKNRFVLPTDPEDLKILLAHYRKDLSDLYRYLTEESYRQSKNPDRARRIVQKIWKKLALPAPDWFKNL